MRIILVSLAVAIIGLSGCGDSDNSGGGTGDPAAGEGKLTDINLAHPYPEELGDSWVYSRGKRGPNSHGRTVNENYKNDKTGKQVTLTIQKLRNVSDARETYDSKVAKFKSPPHSGLGQEARVEPRGSKRRPYTYVCFRRANVVVFLNQLGKDHSAAMHIARIIDRKIKDSIK